MAHEKPAREAVDAAAERVDRVGGADNPQACQRIGFALRHVPPPVALGHYGGGVAQCIMTRLEIGVAAGPLDRSRHEPEIADDAAYQAAAAPAVRQDGESRLLLGDEQEKRLVAAHRSLVIECDTASGELPGPTPEAVAAAQRLGARLAHSAQLDVGERTGRAELVRREPQQVAGGRPEPAGPPPRLRVLARPCR